MSLSPSPTPDFLFRNPSRQSPTLVAYHLAESRQKGLVMPRGDAKPWVKLQGANAPWSTSLATFLIVVDKVVLDFLHRLP